MVGGRRAAVVAIFGSLLAACAAPIPSPSASPDPSASRWPTPPLAATVPINVRFRGNVNCNIGFSFACAPSLSVFEAGAEVPDDWRRADNDPWWSSSGRGATWTLLGGVPAVAPGQHQLVISLIGSSDVASRNPDGTVASELMGRCTAEVDVALDATSLDIVVRFADEPDETAATCTIEAGGS